MLDDKLKAIQERAREAFEAAQNSKDLYNQKVEFLGKQGSFSALMKEMGALPKEERPEFGKKVNEVKKQLEILYSRRAKEIDESELQEQLAQDAIDLTLPGTKRRAGSRHPIHRVTKEVVEIFSRIGFSVRSGPMIEKDDYNFTALNIPPDHPARDMQDTFYIDEHHVLRTQTSPIQIHSLEKEELPLRVLGPGSVFRVDADITHAPMFHQMEGMWIDKKVSMSDLKGSLEYFYQNFFGAETKIRLRPSFFPFTEPSAEVDCSCPKCGGEGCRLCSFTGWIEVAGCGLVHPNVLSRAGVDPKEWQGYAFGMGIERLAMVKYGIGDIRLFCENDNRFLEQFQ